MRLLQDPIAPRVSLYHAFFPYLGSQLEWRKFVPGYDAGVAAG
jgi:hypothetical protein